MTPVTQTMTNRAGDLINLLEHDHTYATSRQYLADAMGLTVGQVGYLLGTVVEARVAWDEARARIKEDRCAIRRCSMCSTVKARREFPMDRRDGCGIGRVCKQCHRLRMRAYRAS